MSSSPIFPELRAPTDWLGPRWTVTSRCRASSTRRQRSRPRPQVREQSDTTPTGTGAEETHRSQGQTILTGLRPGRTRKGAWWGPSSQLPLGGHAYRARPRISPPGSRQARCWAAPHRMGSRKPGPQLTRNRGTSGAAGGGVPVDLTEKRAEVTDVSILTEHQPRDVAEAETGLFL
jgi:hypothetical protein